MVKTGYATFKESPKALITSEQIGPGQVELEYLAPSLFSEFRQISLHTHSGVKSRRIEIASHLASHLKGETGSHLEHLSYFST